MVAKICITNAHSPQEAPVCQDVTPQTPRIAIDPKQQGGHLINIPEGIDRYVTVITRATQEGFDATIPQAQKLVNTNEFGLVFPEMKAGELSVFFFCAKDSPVCNHSQHAFAVYFVVANTP